MKGNKQNIAIEYYEKHNYESGVYKEKSKQAESLLKSINMVKIKPYNRVLDIGCGVGIIGSRFGNKFKSEVHGIDLSPSAIKIARSHGILAKVADIDGKWPYKGNYFDVVLGVQIIEHIYNPDNFLLEAGRVLKKNGILILTTPNLGAWFNRIILLFGYQPFFTEVSTVDKTLGLDFTKKLTSNRETVGHLRVFTLKALKDLLKLYNFKEKYIKGNSVDYFPKYVSLFDKILSKFPPIASDLVVISEKQI